MLGESRKDVHAARDSKSELGRRVAGLSPYTGAGSGGETPSEPRAVGPRSNSFLRPIPPKIPGRFAMRPAAADRSGTMTKPVLAMLFLSCAATPAVAQNLSFDELHHRMIERRAVEAVIWGMSAVNADLMRQAALKAGANENEVVFWSRPVDWRNQTLTPNPDAIYLMVFFNTKNGPVVLEIPPAEGGNSITANIDDIWQMPLEDAGPSGADKGKGGKYLILPPGHADTIPNGYIPLRALTYSGYALIRSNLASHADADIAISVAYGKRVRVYDFKDSAHPPATRFTDAVTTLFDSTIPYDERFFDSLNRIVQTEPWLDRDRAMIDTLRSIGIKKGKPFNPDASTKTPLVTAVREAHAWLDHLYETKFPPYWPTARWAVPALTEHLTAFSQWLLRSEHLSNRCARDHLHPRLRRHQTAGRRAILPDQQQGQARQSARRGGHLSPAWSCERPCGALLVGDRL
jgi:hypothetical protein